MNVLICGARWNPFHSDRVMGGKEKAEFLLIQVLIAHGHSVDHFIPADSTGTVPGANAVYSTATSKNCADQTGDPNKAAAAIVKSLLAKKKYDLVLNNHDCSSSSVNLLRGVSGAVHWIHTATDTVGIAKFGYYNSLIKASATQLILFASDWHRDRALTDIKKCGDRCSLDGLNEENFRVMHPYVNEFKPKISDVHEGAIVVARASEDKGIVKLLAKRKLTDAVWYAPVPTEHSVKYADRMEFRFGVPHAEIMADLSTKHHMIVASMEAFGIAGVEANLHGVPIALISAKPHAFEGRLHPLGYEKFSSVDEYLAGLHRLDRTALDRFELSEATLNMHTQAAMLEAFLHPVKPAEDPFSTLYI